MPVAQKLRCRVEQLINHGEHVYSVELLPERRAPTFRPGQFLHLALDEYDPSGFWPDSRVFSIASAPAANSRLRISYSVRGRFTTRMERELQVGCWVWIKLPFGEFEIDDTQDAVLFAGGTGITAFTAFLDGLTLEYRKNIYLIYGARNSNLLIYRYLIEQQAKLVPQFRYQLFVEHPDTRVEDLADDLAVIPGRICIDTIWPRISLLEHAEYYISGPPTMLAALSSDLHARGVRPDAIGMDAWE
jgi:ferredoxin-NADP reductase